MVVVVQHRFQTMPLRRSMLKNVMNMVNNKVGLEKKVNHMYLLMETWLIASIDLMGDYPLKTFVITAATGTKLSKVQHLTFHCCFMRDDHLYIYISKLLNSYEKIFM